MNQHWPKSDSALDSGRLPRFTFIADDGTEESVALSAQTAEIRAVAGHLRRHIPQGTVTGLIYRSGRALVVNWLACLLAGLRPLIVQYPTRKQSRAYWTDSVRNVIEVAGIGAFVADAHCTDILRESTVAGIVVTQADLASLAPDGDASAFSLAEFSIVQLSSGTTGHRKAIEFCAGQLFAHVRDYNASLALGPEDRIVSWLPLYHDMGYIACFVMPMLLGIDVVMMDPMTWIKQPELLFQAIERHAGTICYMPNFGFEVMARAGHGQLPSMRWWISCSEPVSHQTAAKFVEAVSADPESFAPCYAMAENVFAVSIRRGVEVREIDGAQVVSCGPAIANVDLKEVDGEIWVRSPASLNAYMGGSDIRDADGFYPTGDLGSIIGGELFITGRKQDLLIQAGRKYMLSDVDLALNRLFPWIKGRAAAVQIYDARLGTQKPLVLIEADDFFLRSDQGEIAAALKDAIGLDQVDVEFVPPRFLTKTSSGKFNRKRSAADWALAQQLRESRGGAADPLADLRESFAHVDWDKPVEKILDSLSLEVLRIILTGTTATYDGKLTLSEIAQSLGRTQTPSDAEAPETIRIVSLADRANFAKLTEADIDKLSRKLRRPVTFEHLCLPPSPIILSDLIFHDYFQARAEGGNFAAVDRAFATLKSASVIIVDDAAEMLIAGAQAYGALSHNLERDPNCDLLSFRWQRYPQYHDTLPLTFVAGPDMAFADRTEVLGMLSAYLKTPIFKIALVAGLEPFTQDWDYHLELREGGKSVRRIEPDAFIPAFLKWVRRRDEPLKTVPSSVTAKLQMDDLGHFCCHVVRQDAADKVIAAFDSFCIAGQRSSVPYLRKEMERQGKDYVYVTSYSSEMLKQLPQEYDCLVICGAQGEYKIEGPTVALMRASKKWRVKGIDDPDISRLHFNPALKAYPQSGTDWFYRFAFDRDGNIGELEAARGTNKHAKRAEFGEREQARQERHAHRAEKMLRREKRALRRERRQGAAESDKVE